MGPKIKEPISLAKWIWNSYKNTALIPIILIILFFLIVFFSINIIMEDQLSSLSITAYDRETSVIVSHEATFFHDQLKTIEINTRTLAAQMEKALKFPAEQGADVGDRLQYSPDGVYYTVKDNGGAAVFYSGLVPVNAPEREKVARILTMQDLMKSIYELNPLASAVYLNTYDSLNVIYPYVDVIDQYAPKMDITSFNFYYEADSVHNPDRTARWTDIYYDPAGHGWMTSSIAPVYNGDVLEGVVGIDVSVTNIEYQLSKLDIPADGYSLLVGSDGTILAMTANGKNDWPQLESVEKDSAIESDTFVPKGFSIYIKPEAAELADDIFSNPSGVSTVSFGDGDNRVSWDTVSNTGWKIILVVPEKSITREIDRLGSGMQKIGLILATVMIIITIILFHVLFIRAKRMSRSLSQPLVELSSMAFDIGTGNYYQKTPEFNVTELQMTALTIAGMGQRLGDINRNLLATQTELKEKESYLQAVIYSIDDAVVELDEDGVITNIFINEGSYPTSNVSSSFSSIDSIFTSSKAQIIKSLLRSVVETGEQKTFETEVETSIGLRWAVARMSLVSRDPVRVVVTARDITPRKEMEESLRKAKDDAESANRAKSQFLSSMSHELRTPLNAVLGFAQVLEMDPSAPLTGMQKECVYEIMKAGNHLLELINEVLDLARIEAGKTRLSIEPVSINTVIEETMTIIIPTAEKYGIKVETEAGSCGGRYVKADKTKLKQVLINLLINAIKYNKPDGKVSYYCEVNGDKVRFHIADTGIGIPESEIESIFRPFHRLNNMENIVEGTGVGLAVVRQLTEMMGGIIGAESIEGRGSHFFIELPAAEEVTLRSERPVIADKTTVTHFKSAEKKKLLYIEDNQANLRLVMRILELIPNVTFLSAPTAEEGIEIAIQEMPNVILLDINLPGMDGYEAFETLQELEETENIPVIAVSSNAMEREIEQAITMGFYDYITKPISADIFIEKIKRVFSGGQ